MLHNFRLAFHCLLIVCILFAVCTTPVVEEGRAQKLESQKTLETTQVYTSVRGAAAPQKTAAPRVLQAKTGKISYSDSTTTIDASNTSQGYVMVKYEGSNKKVKLQITRAGSTTCTFELVSRGSYEVFPLSNGDGKYTIAVFENAGGNQYAPGLSKTVSVKMTNAFGPFLYPNQFVNFNAKSNAVAIATELASAAVSDLEFVEKVYKYTMEHLSYNDARAATVGSSNYLPNVDSVLKEGSGICFDYSAVMAAMLRSQGIPTRLEVGFAANQRHAWISTYIKDVGWIDDIIAFDGKTWRRLDPTLADQGNSAYTVKDANYQVQYSY